MSFLPPRKCLYIECSGHFLPFMRKIKDLIVTMSQVSQRILPDSMAFQCFILKKFGQDPHRDIMIWWKVLSKPALGFGCNLLFVILVHRPHLIKRSLQRSAVDSLSLRLAPWTHYLKKVTNLMHHPGRPTCPFANKNDI